MKIIYFLLYICLFIHINYYSGLSASENTFRVFFNDKGPDIFESGTPLFDSTIASISSKSVIRRKSLFGNDNAVTIEDAPIYDYYVKTIEELNAKVLLRLKWRNYIVIKCEDSIINRIEALPFVKAVQRTQSKLLASKSLIHKDRNVFDEILLVDNCGSLDYGMSFFQNYILNVVELHRLGFTGEDVIIGLIDTGFDYSYHSTLAHINVINQYDFINGDTIVRVEIGDNPAQSNHGTLVLSICGGFADGKLIGPAPFAKYILAKTEDLNSETRIEEDNYAAAVEWMEALGVDIISSSLGYFNYDSTDESYSYNDLNGNFSISSVAVNRAVKLGVVCVTAAGNSGPNPKTISTPGDADSVITVGAVIRDSTGAIVPWRGTSRGPLENGNIKPNLAALGAGVVGASLNDENTVILTSGTSTATPLIAGSAALLLSAFPELKPWELREILYFSASNFPIPDNTLGYGIPNLLNAMKNAGIIIGPPSIVPVKDFIRVFSYIITDYFLADLSLWVKFDGEQSFYPQAMYPTYVSNLYVADIPIERLKSKSAEAYIIATDLLNQRRYPYSEGKYFDITPEYSSIPCGINKSDLPISQFDSDPTYLYPIVSRNGSIQFNISLPVRTKIKIEIYSSIGELVYNNDLTWRNPGIANIELELNFLGSGVYYARITHSDKTEVKNFIITR